MTVIQKYLGPNDMKEVLSTQDSASYYLSHLPENYDEACFVWYSIPPALQRMAQSFSLI